MPYASLAVEPMTAAAVRAGLFFAVIPALFSIGAWVLWPDLEPLVLVFRAGGLMPVLMGDGEMWRLASTGLLHLEGYHLVANLVSLLGLGAVCAQLLGTGRAALIILVTGIASAGAVALWAGLPTVGASGAVFGLLGANLVAWTWNKAQLSERERLHIGAPLVFFVICALTVVWQGEGSDIAHTAGAVVGFVLALLLPAPIPTRIPVVLALLLAGWGATGLSQVDNARWRSTTGPIVCDRAVTNGLALVCSAKVAANWHPEIFDQPKGPWQERGQRHGRKRNQEGGSMFINLDGTTLIWIRGGYAEFSPQDLKQALQSFDRATEE